MKIELTKKPQNVSIIGGFPGFGLIGTITTEYLMDHIEDIEKIGFIWFDEMNPLVAIHEGKVVDPLGVFYSKKYNLVILHAITNVNGVEWKLAEAINQVAAMLKAREILCVEGVGAMQKKAGSEVYYFASENEQKWSIVAKKMDEGIIMGVTAAALLKAGKVPLSCVFAETTSNMPDSRAAARIIKVLDGYLGLKIDPKPLLKKAEQFENKLKGLLKKSGTAQTLKDKKELSYMG